jgi:hypothetical protein
LSDSNLSCSSNETIDLILVSIFRIHNNNTLTHTLAIILLSKKNNSNISIINALFVLVNISYWGNLFEFKLAMLLFSMPEIESAFTKKLKNILLISLQLPEL